MLVTQMKSMDETVKERLLNTQIALNAQTFNEKGYDGGTKYVEVLHDVIMKYAKNQGLYNILQFGSKTEETKPLRLLVGQIRRYLCQGKYVYPLT